MDDIQYGTIGAKFKLTIRDPAGDIVNVSAATTKVLVVTPPDKVKRTYTLSFETDGTDGVVYYTTTSGVLNQTGIWRYHAIITMSGGQEFPSDIHMFRVKGNL